MTAAKLHLSALLASALVSSTVAADERKPSPRQEDQAHGHHFYSERLQNGAALIDYVVCNKTDRESDFFWTGASFGVSQFNPLPAHHCLEKKDYLRRTKGLTVDFDSSPTKVYVRDKSATVPTVYWCGFRGIDRCNEGLLGSIASWSSSLREFAQGASDEPFQPIISVDVALEGGQYHIDVRRSGNTGQLIVVAKSPLTDGIALESAAGTEAKAGSLGDFFFDAERIIGTDLRDDMHAVAFGPSTTKDLDFRLIFENQSDSAIALAILVSGSDGPTYRIDTVPLTPYE